MNEKDVVDLLKKVESIGIKVWITGGWGVDAILGQQTRPHSDIDFFVQKKDAFAFIEMIKSNGYCCTKVESDDQSGMLDITLTHLFYCPVIQVSIDFFHRNKLWTASEKQ